MPVKLFLSFVLAAAATLLLASSATAVKPKSGPYGYLGEDDSKGMADFLQFNVPKNGKSLKKLQIIWVCRGKYIRYRPALNPGINKKGKFKLVGIFDGTSIQFELQGTFVSKVEAKFKIDIDGCGAADRGLAKRHNSSGSGS